MRFSAALNLRQNGGKEHYERAVPDRLNREGIFPISLTELESYLCVGGRRQLGSDRPRSAPAVAAGKSILGVLQQLEDEVRAVVVPIRQEHRPDSANAGTVAARVVGANGCIG